MVEMAIRNEPQWLSATFVEAFRDQFPSALSCLCFPRLLVAALPPALCILCFVLAKLGSRKMALESIILFAVCFAPQGMHLIAWDSSKIRTYSLFSCFVALWIYSETRQLEPRSASEPRSLSSRFVYVGVLTANALISIPLMDAETDRFGVLTRLCLYTPAIAAMLIPLLRELQVNAFPDLGGAFRALKPRIAAIGGIGMLIVAHLGAMFTLESDYRPGYGSVSQARDGANQPVVEGP
jgi:hypothetical protein